MDRYEEALERAKAGKPMDEVFPELKESEDERTRKEIIHYILYGTKETVGKDTKNTWIAYLEKQKEQNGSLRVIKDASEWEIIKEQKPNIELIQRSWYMEGYTDGEFKREPMWNLVTGKSGPRYEKNEKYGQPLEQKPAEWSEEDEKILERFLGWLQGTMGEKTYSSWLKSLHERFNIQPKQEWSEEDENKLYQVMEVLLADKTIALRDNPHCKALHRAYDELLDWLKSLRPQPHWKPSENKDVYEIAYERYPINNRLVREVTKDINEDTRDGFIDGYNYCNSTHWKPSKKQMEALEEAFRKDGGNEYRKVINSLYCDLQKLL